MIVFFTPEKERMDSCFRRNDEEEEEEDGFLSAQGWRDVYVGMTGRLRRNDLPVG